MRVNPLKIRRMTSPSMASVPTIGFKVAGSCVSATRNIRSPDACARSDNGEMTQHAIAIAKMRKASLNRIAYAQGDNVEALGQRLAQHLGW